MAQTIASLLIKIGVQVSEVNKGFKQVEGKMKGLQSGFSKTAKSLGLVFGGSAVIGGIKNMVKATSDFELDLAKLNQTAGLSTAELNKVGGQAQSLASKFGVSSGEIVHGLTELNRLGYSTADALGQLPQILKFNIATGSDFHTTVGLMETALKDFDLELDQTGKITDIFTKTIANGRIKTDDLADAFKKAGASGKNAGASVSDVSAAVSILGVKGFSGAEAGTALNAIFGNLTKTGSKAQKTLQGLGVSLTDSQGRARPFGEVITDIQKKTQGMTDAQKNNIASLVGGTEHQAKFLALIAGAPGTFQEFSSELSKSGGTTNKFFNEIDKTAAQSLSRLSASFEVFQQKLGAALGPAIKVVADALQGLVDWFNNLSPSTQTLIGYITAAVAIFTVLTTVIAAAALIFGALSAPIVGIVAGISILIAALIALWANSDKVVAFLKSAWEGVKSFFSALWDGIKAGVQAFGQFFVDLWKSIVEGVVAAFQWLYNHNYYFKALVDKIREIFNAAKAFITAVWNTISTFLAQKWESIKNKATSIFNAIKGVVSSIWSSISGIIKGWASQAYQWGVNFLTGLINGIKSKVGAIIQTVKSIGSKIASFLGFHSPTEKGPLSQADHWMPNFINMLTQGLEMGIPKLQMAVGDVAMSLASASGATTGSVVNNNVNVYPRQASLDARGLNRELERMRFLNGGMF